MDVKIFAKTCEELAKNQVMRLASISAFDGAKIRIMPDTHAGKGSVIGFTANLGDKVVPNVVGVDIGCGMLVANFGKVNIDLKSLDNFIRKNIPSGMTINDKVSDSIYESANELISSLHIAKTYNEKKNYFINSVGTLGGGNHFIEVDKDDDGNIYLVIHTGSRNLGVHVCKFYQDLAIKNCDNSKKLAKEEIRNTIKTLTDSGRAKEISKAIRDIKEKYSNIENSIPKELSYIEGEDRLNYLHDMDICQKYASMNRFEILNKISKFLKLKPIDTFETIHNYISFKDNIIRKGAISCYLGEKVIIPLNMRDGSIIAIGKGNEDWNFSGPHGAGRLMSRAKARECISMKDFKDSMSGIYTTSVNKNTIDESPMAYKDANEILECIKDTVDVINVIKPIYNFKCSEEEDI